MECPAGNKPGGHHTSGAKGALGVLWFTGLGCLLFIVIIFVVIIFVFFFKIGNTFTAVTFSTLSYVDKTHIQYIKLRPVWYGCHLTRNE